RSTIARTSSALVTSQRRPSARTPSADRSAAVWAQRSALRAQSTTSAPISASAVAICRPSPPVPALAPSPDVQQRRERLAAFMEAQVYPNERALAAEDDGAEALMRELQAKAKAAGLWAMFIGPDAGGTGTGFLPYVYLNEVIGRSLVAPRIFGCQAPDTGNAEILHEFGTPEQKAR